MEIQPLGHTALPDEILLEYIDSLKTIYTIEAYDLFTHNCNNFTHDVAQFLTGSGIPGHITSLPSTVLNTPFGQMLKPMLDQSLRPITTAPSAPSPSAAPTGLMVKVANSSAELDSLLTSAHNSCAIVFFTSATCGPCRVLYPHYEELATDVGEKAVFVKVDVGHAQDAGAKYQISATPTFITFIHGEQVERWSGGGNLKSKVDMLLRMTYPRAFHILIRDWDLGGS
jgi:thiol-disulfide isomerase/thioredoxin